VKRTSAVLITLMLMATVSWAQQQSAKPETRVKIGVLDLETTGGDAAFASAVSLHMVQAVSEVGFYEVFSQSAIEDIYEQLKTKFPRTCRDPRCVRDIGGTAGMERILYGSLDKDDKTCGIRLSLVDVQTKQVMQSVSLEGEPGAQAEQLIDAAVAKINGRPDEDLKIKVNTYWGPQVHHEKQLLISTGACLGLGIIWAAASGSLKHIDNAPPDYSSWDTDLSGLPTGAEHIPMFGRPAALANSYLAVSDDAYGVLYNPAGVAWVPNAEATVGYQYRFGTLNNIALAYANKATRELGFGQAFLYAGDDLESEVSFTTAVAYKFNRLLRFLRPLSVGVSIKLSNKITATPEGATGGGSAFGLGADVGLLWELSPQIRYGAVLKNAFTIQRWNNTVQNYKYYEANPMTLNMGGAFKAGYTTLLVANGQIPLYVDQPWKMAGGIEQEFFRVLKVRLGIEKEIQSKVATEWKFTGGLGLAVATEKILGKYVAVDASYEYNTLPLLYVVNMSLRFGF